MCLRIRRIPHKCDKIHAIRCIKHLVKPGPQDGAKAEGTYVTPYKRTVVPRNGILVAKSKTRYHDYCYGGSSVKRVGSSIEEGAIHAYQDGLRSVVSGHFEAFAFGVRAYGYIDLACKFIYIPHCDTTKQKAKREAFCKKWWSSRGQPTWPEIRKVFGEYL